MIPTGVEVFVVLSPVDLRYGFDRLTGLVEEQVGRSARSGALFVFYGKRRTALKILYFGGSGMCLFYKRADRGTFTVPEASTKDATSIELNERELEELLSSPRGRSSVTGSMKPASSAIGGRARCAS